VHRQAFPASEPLDVAADDPLQRAEAGRVGGLERQDELVGFGGYPAGPQVGGVNEISAARSFIDTTLDAAAALAAEHGLRSVTMSQIAEQAGVGRATLYRYFPDVESILIAWHGRQIAGHLEYLAEARDRARGAAGRLEAVLGAYALVSRQSRGHDSTELAALLHRDEQVGRAQRQVRDMMAGLLRDAAKAGAVRDDAGPPRNSLPTACMP
jgi:AcrR family transcriptional regulator